MARRRFFVDEIRGGRAEIEGEDAHHLTRVLRVEAGQKYEISDNRAVYLAEVETARKDRVSFAVIERMAVGEPLVHTTLFAALIKFERFEWLIEKATELGVESIVPVIAERSEKGLEIAAGKRVERWRRIAREASEQSRRATLPAIAAPVRFADVPRGDAGMKIVLDEEGSRPLMTALGSNAGSVAILLGPEGGWTARERSGWEDAGWIAVSLGPTILRAETAGVAALAVVNAHALAERSNNSAL